MSEEIPGRSRVKKALSALLLLALVAVVVVFAVRRIKERLRPLELAPTPPVAVETLEVSPRPFAVTRRYTGSVEAVRRVRVAARMTGRVLRIHHREGEAVEEGALLVTLDAAELADEVQRLEAAQRRTRAELDFWKKQLERDERLLAARTIARTKRDETRRMVDTLTAALDETRYALAAARTRLGYAEIRAPFAGRIQALLTELGDMAVPGKPLVELVAPGSLRAVIRVPEQDLGRLRLGTPVTVRVPSAGRKLSCRVDRIYPAVDPATRNGSFEARLPDARRLRPGMAVEAEVTLAREAKAVVVPHQAVQRRKGGTGVFVARAGVARWRPVETGEVQGGEVRVLSGVEPGDRVIVTPDPRLQDGTPIASADGGGSR